MIEVVSEVTEVFVGGDRLSRCEGECPCCEASCQWAEDALPGEHEVRYCPACGASYFDPFIEHPNDIADAYEKAAHEAVLAAIRGAE